MRKSFLSWVGGKSKLTSQIIELMPEHRCYCEVFAGASWVLFAKPESKIEIINDINMELTTLYRVVQNHLEEFVSCLKWLLVARDEFDRFMQATPDTLTDIQRSVRFYYLVKTAYGSKIQGQTFSISTKRPSNFNLLRIEEDLSNAHLRLARVYIENKNYQTFLQKYDKDDDVFFYIDPPYHGCENYYGKDIFAENDFYVLAEILANLKGKFMLSINDTPFTRQQFAKFNTREVSLTYSINMKNRNDKVRELLIMNY